jgi:hypothetical protein
VLGTWKILPRPEASERYNFDRARLQLTADDEGWAVQGSDLLRLKDGNWSIVENPSGTNLADIDLVPAREGQEPGGWIVGDEGTVLRLQGDTWIKVEGAPVSELAAVAGISEKEAWAVGEKEILHYANDTWSTLDNPSGQTLQDVVIDSDGVGWAVGANRTILKLAGGVWTVYKTGP